MNVKFHVESILRAKNSKLTRKHDIKIKYKVVHKVYNKFQVPETLILEHF